MLFRYPHNDRVTVPFGYIGNNGLNLSRSVKNPNSRLSRVVRFLHTHGPSTLKTIKSVSLGTVKFEDRGWGSTFFSLCVKVGFLGKVRVGSHVVYTLTPKVKKLYNIK